MSNKIKEILEEKTEDNSTDNSIPTGRDILLTVKSIQKFRDEKPDVIDLITEGKLYKKNDSTYLCYDESELTGVENNKVILKIKNNSVQMNRFGEFESNMIFEKGKRDVSMYGTPYGQFRVEVVTDKINIELEEEKGKIKVDYTVSISGSPEVKHNLLISY